MLINQHDNATCTAVLLNWMLDNCHHGAVEIVQSTIKKFLQLEAAGGILLLIAAALAMVLKNSGLAEIYQAFLETPGEIRIGELYIAKPLFL